MTIIEKKEGTDAAHGTARKAMPARLTEGRLGFGKKESTVLRRLFENYGDSESRMTFAAITGMYNEIADRQGLKQTGEDRVREIFKAFRAEWDKHPPLLTEPMLLMAAEMRRRGRSDEAISAKIKSRWYPDNLSVTMALLREQLGKVQSARQEAPKEKQEWTLVEVNRLTRLRHENPGANAAMLSELFNREAGSGELATADDIKRYYASKKPADTPQGCNNGGKPGVWVEGSELLERLLELAGNGEPYANIAKTLNREFGTGLSANAVGHELWKRGHRQKRNQDEGDGLEEIPVSIEPESSVDSMNWQDTARTLADMHDGGADTTTGVARFMQSPIKRACKR